MKARFFVLHETEANHPVSAYSTTYERFENVLICIIYIGSEGPFRPISNFPFFCQNKNSLELFNIIFENSLPKGLFWANKKKFKFSALSPDSRKLLTTALKLSQYVIVLDPLIKEGDEILR